VEIIDSCVYEDWDVLMAPNRQSRLMVDSTFGSPVSIFSRLWISGIDMIFMSVEPVIRVERGCVNSGCAFTSLLTHSSRLFVGENRRLVGNKRPLKGLEAHTYIQGRLLVIGPLSTSRLFTFHQLSNGSFELPNSYSDHSPSGQTRNCPRPGTSGPSRTI